MTLLAFFLAAHEIAGLWHAAVLNSAGEPVAFQLELSRKGNHWQGALINGPDRNLSTAGTFDGKALRLEFNYWDGVLEATLDQGRLEGVFTRTYQKTKLVRKFRAQREPVYVPGKPAGASVQGEWILEVHDTRRSVWRAQFRQNGNRLEGTLIPVTGDSGVLTGYIEENTLTLSRFDGIRATLLKARVTSQGTLDGKLNSTSPLTGRRAGQAAIAPPDAAAYTRMRNSQEPLRFAFEDLDGWIISSADPRFHNKVLIVTITGSWCPNCHDEAPLLKELYERYRRLGLEIVAIGFEYTGDAGRDKRQLRLFAQKHAISYPVLYAGSTDEAAAKLPQLENFGAYPTTIFIGRDGRVRAIHAGFDGPATGERHLQLKREMHQLVGRLLGE
ncbi:MAG: redoxin domain-containing protein [Acidobacteria bacterium]|nr:redoxin domain-containing protein [Acidobacteriota bacterium]